MGTFIVVVIIVVVVFFALRGTKKHLKGEGGCCGMNCDKCNGCGNEEVKKG